MKAAAKFQIILDDWDNEKETLSDALRYNRRLWTIFTTGVMRDDHPLPKPVKQNIANLGLFIFQRTIDIELDAAPEKLKPLISINCEIAAGLRGRPPESPVPEASE